MPPLLLCLYSYMPRLNFFLNDPCASPCRLHGYDISHVLFRSGHEQRCQCCRNPLILRVSAVLSACSALAPLYSASVLFRFALSMLADGTISIATKSKIESSTIDSVRGEGAKAVQKRRLQIFITRGPKFEEHRAEVRRLAFPLQLTAIVRRNDTPRFSDCRQCCCQS